MDEELLSVWLRLTSVIDNQRLAAAHTSLSGKGPLPFNEAVVCGLLARAQGTGSVLTASDLCRHTRILKSQMNAILRSLEDKGAVERRHAETDRRRIELRLLPEGMALYQESHRHVQRLVGRLIHEMGEEKVCILLPLLRQAADIFDAMQQEAS
ncbi:MAG: MarR family transcriptional regulator [Oscillospiraceae bacterium]|nr:MarR family transcriptional regulator [Oscillospiraceae bacterium]